MLGIQRKILLTYSDTPHFVVPPQKNKQYFSLIFQFSFCIYMYLLNPIRTLAQLIICSRSLIITWPFHQFQSFKLKCKTQDTQLNNPTPKNCSNPQNIEKMWPKIAAKGGFCSAVRGHLWCSRGQTGFQNYLGRFDLQQILHSYIRKYACKDDDIQLLRDFYKKMWSGQEILHPSWINSPDLPLDKSSLSSLLGF